MNEEDELLDGGSRQVPGASVAEETPLFSAGDATDDYNEYYSILGDDADEGNDGRDREALRARKALRAAAVVVPPEHAEADAFVDAIEPTPDSATPSATSERAADADADAAAERQSRQDRRYAEHRNLDEDLQYPDWAKHEKHVFILSMAGKPIYSRYGSEDKLASIMGVMQALVSFVQEEKNQLRSFRAGQHTFVFSVRGPIILVAVACTGESEFHLSMQLNYVYNQILSVLTQSQLTRIFDQRINYDLRRMLSGTEKQMDNLLDMLDRNASFFLGAVRCLRMASSARDKIAQVLQASRIKDLVFALLIADNQLICLLRRKRYSLQPLDVHLIFNWVAASQSFRQGETWAPICLPKFNTEGFLYAHVSYIDEACTACLLLLSNNKDVFPELSECRTKIVQSLSSNGSLQAISQALARKSYRTTQLETPELRHFLYMTKSTKQFTMPALEPPYNLQEEEQRLFRQYQFVHQHMHSAHRSMKIFFQIGSKETMLGWVTSGFELYACFGPLVTKRVAIDSVLRLIRWMKTQEDSLFMINSHTF
eukprot:m.117070 g.117070  ORF g.117070 m.117070 type:complete len:541 (-) comp16087_c0_seq2:294-1916(-)